MTRAITRPEGLPVVTHNHSPSGPIAARSRCPKSRGSVCGSQVKHRCEYLKRYGTQKCEISGITAISADHNGYANHAVIVVRIHAPRCRFVRINLPRRAIRRSTRGSLPPGRKRAGSLLLPDAVDGILLRQRLEGKGNLHAGKQGALPGAPGP